MIESLPTKVKQPPLQFCTNAYDNFSYLIILNWGHTAVWTQVHIILHVQSNNVLLFSCNAVLYNVYYNCLFIVVKLQWKQIILMTLYRK